VLETAYPAATVEIAPTSRKGAFELSIGDAVLYSKLERYGPAKSRDALPSTELVCELLRAHFTSPAAAAPEAEPEAKPKAAPKAKPEAKPKAAPKAAPKKQPTAKETAAPARRSSRRAATTDA